MPIRPFLADQAFTPEQIAEMSAALESVCNTLNLDRGADDSRTRLVAKTIIAFAARRPLRRRFGRCKFQRV
jgi:hypothetical protein